MKTKNLFLILVLLFIIGFIQAQNGITIYLNPYTGDDSNNGSKEKPLKTLAAASHIVNHDSSNAAITIILSQGIYAINETSTFKPVKRSFTKTARLTIRAEVLPDDEIWNTSSMPTFIHTMQLSDWLQGQKDPFGGTAYGIMIETNHVTIQGIKILGMPVVEHPKEGYIQRVYAIARLNPEFDDLEITQCFFAGDEVTNPNHLPIIANGNYIWISQLTRDGGQQVTGNVSKSEPIHYKVYNSLFAGNSKFVGTGGGPALNFKDIDPSMLELINTQMSDKPIEIEMNQSKRNYLHPVEGSEADKIGAGLFITKK